MSQYVDAPDSPGYWWVWGHEPAINGLKWILMRVLVPLWVDPERKDLRYSWLDRSGLYEPQPSQRWIKVQEPEPIS